jgi:hypothetical protein
MKNLRSRYTLALAALSLCIGASALAQTTVAATVGTTNPTTTTSTPPPATQRVPRGFVTDLAKASLAKQGITNPTKAQLAAESKAIAAQRAQGKGWGVIAQSLGLNLGQVVSAANQARHEARKDHDKRGDDKDGKGNHGKHHEGDHGGKNKSEHKTTSTMNGTTPTGAQTGQGGNHGAGGGGHSGGGGGKGK